MYSSSLKFAVALILELVLKVLGVQKVEVGLLCLPLLDGVRLSFGVMSSAEDDYECGDEFADKMLLLLGN